MSRGKTLPLSVQHISPKVKACRFIGIEFLYWSSNHRTVRYVVPVVKRKIKGTVKVLRRDGNTAEAIPLYADWIPQANGFAASPVNPL